MIKDKLNLVPDLPGCYLMKNKKEIVIYVGKAKKLKRRLKSYFNGRTKGKTTVLVGEINNFEYIVTNSELEAFILENNLIKKYNPKYNILMKDDKSYPYIELTNEKIPKLVVKREINVNKKHTNLYGPYPNVYAARRIVNLLNRVYPFRKCNKMPKKVCLYYHIGECLGFCENKNLDEKINEMKREVILFLKGNDEILLKKINEKINIHSASLNYEQALNLKNEFDYISTILQKQKVELNDGINRDIFNFYSNNGYINIQVFFLRNGKLIESKSNIKPVICNIKEEIEYFIIDFYSKRNIIPKEIIVPKIVNKEIISEILNVKTIYVEKGKKRELFDMCYKNSKINLENEMSLIFKNEERSFIANRQLMELLNLKNLNIIECFDNSNLFGSYTVSGMVTFIDGVPSKKDYRKFKISFEKNDDFNIMKEVIYRRYFRCLRDNLVLPDLILLDGGINQINACKSVLVSLNLKIKVCGLKKDVYHNTSELIDGDTYQTIDINKSSNIFYLLVRIQDEVHNYTINYHKQIRSKGSLSSILDMVDGIGAVRKKELITRFGSLKKIESASLEDLNEFLPGKISKDLYKFLKEKREEKNN